jgi:hypothetical protein
LDGVLFLEHRTARPDGAANRGGYFPKLDWGPGREAVQELVDRFGGEQGSRAFSLLSGYDTPLPMRCEAAQKIKLTKRQFALFKSSGQCRARATFDATQPARLVDGISIGRETLSHKGSQLGEFSAKLSNQFMQA